MTDETIRKTYRDVEIVYVESDDRWNFTVNGRERNLESLAKAKESIDRALDREVKERPWKPFEAWYENSYGDRDYQKVRVTSEADRDYGRRHFWIVQGQQKRRKVAMDKLFAVSSENDKRIQQVTDLRKKAESLYDQARTVHDSLTPILAENASESDSGALAAT